MELVHITLFTFLFTFQSSSGNCNENVVFVFNMRYFVLLFTRCCQLCQGQIEGSSNCKGGKSLAAFQLLLCSDEILCISEQNCGV